MISFSAKLFMGLLLAEVGLCQDPGLMVIGKVKPLFLHPQGKLHQWGNTTLSYADGLARKLFDPKGNYIGERPPRVKDLVELEDLALKVSGRKTELGVDPATHWMRVVDRLISGLLAVGGDQRCIVLLVDSILVPNPERVINCYGLVATHEA